MTTESRRAGGEENEERKPSSLASDDDDDETSSTSSAPCWLVASTPYTGELSARGLVASRKIRRGEVVEVAHCVVLRDYPFENDDDRTRLSKSESNGKCKNMRSATMGLEHYVFFDRRGRSLCDHRTRRNRENGDGGGDGESDGGPSSPPPPPSVRVLLALGAGSLFNHSSSSPNVDWRAGTAESREAPLVRREGDRVRRWRKKSRDAANEKSDGNDDDSALWPVITFYAARNIERGEELTISYGQPWWEEEGDEGEEESDDEEEEEKEEDVDVDGGTCRKGTQRRKATTTKEEKKQRPTHSHMDDEDAFLGAMTLGGGDE